MIAPWNLRRRMMMAAQGGVDVANMLIQGSCTFTDYSVVTMSDGNDYRLLAITQSGNLVLSDAVTCEVCVVGGGANGTQHYAQNFGGGGAYLKNQIINDFIGSEVIVGAAQGISSIGGVSVNAVSGKNGGTGGGGVRINSGGTGDGLSKYPFGDDSYELWADKPHCAGGGGGGSVNDGDFKGGVGGTNGSDGGMPTPDSRDGGAGGIYGGGAGGRGFPGSSAGNATYYGSGGGGGGAYGTNALAAGSGYQGIIYVRIPVNQ